LCCVDTEFIVLEQKDYQQAFRRINENEFKFKKSFIERVVLRDQRLWDNTKLLMNVFTKKRYPRGHCLFKKGEVSPYIWIIVEGQVVFWDHLGVKGFPEPINKKIDLLILGEGEFINEDTLLSNNPSPSPLNVSAEGDVVLYIALKRDLISIMNIKLKLSDYLLNRARNRQTSFQEIVERLIKLELIH
jgi:CRP-like cAMP-binding protein